MSALVYSAGESENACAGEMQVRRPPTLVKSAVRESKSVQWRVLNFPSGYSSGKLCILNRDDSEVPVAMARGPVKVDSQLNYILFGSYELMNRKDGLRSLPENALTKLHLRGIESTDGKPFSLAGIERQQSMTFLYDEETEITEESLNYVAKLPNLRRLSLRYCGITARYLDSCVPLPKLSSLDLSLNSICKEGWEAVGRMKGLTSLRLSSTDANDSAMAQVANLTELDYLNLRGNRNITSQGWSVLPKLVRLRTLEVSDTNFSGRDLIKLTNPRLKRIVVNLKKVNQNELAAFTKMHPRIQINDSGHVDKGTDYLFAPLH